MWHATNITYSYFLKYSSSLEVEDNLKYLYDDYDYMIPPDCEICHDKSKMEECRLIYFKLGDSDKEWEKSAKNTPGFVGHPPYAVWFCNKHFEIAKKYDHLTRSEAMKKIKNEL